MMMLRLQGLICSSKRRIHAAAGRVRKSIPAGAGEATAAAVALVGARWPRRPSTSPLRQLLWKLRSRWRHAMTSSRRGRGQFGYDPQSYSQNFDDGSPREHGFSCSGAS